ncbi:MAG: hypothetical protein IK136_02095 [Oscillospiraceae bacterium]|nr:hypothetical protein [Oscillospiraceae bacterium]
MTTTEDAKYEWEVTILPSMLDWDLKLDTAFTFSLFMDLAAQHAEATDIGTTTLSPRGQFWLTVRTRIRFIRRPGLMEKATAATWAEPPGKFKCIRYYTLKQGDETLVEGKTEWAVLDIRTGRLVNAADIYNEKVKTLDETVCGDSFSRMSEDFSGCRELEPYTVRSTDIDFGRHMHNVAYISALLGEYSVKELREFAVSEMEISFRSPCFEGETLSVFERKTETGVELGVFKPDGKCAALARMVTGK